MLTMYNICYTNSQSLNTGEIMKQPDSQKEPLGFKQLAWINEKYGEQIKRVERVKK